LLIEFLYIFLVLKYFAYW